MALELVNSIFYKNLRVLYDLNFPNVDDSHQAVIEAIFNVLDATKADLDLGKLAMSLQTAEGPWLDIWGDYFGFPREPDENDDDYRDRIIQEIINPKVTIPAIKNAIIRWMKRKYGLTWTPESIDVFEPYTRLLMPSHRGRLSTDYYLWSEDYWTHAVIDISLPDISKLTPELIEYLLWIKAAGVKLVWSSKPNWDIVITSPDGYRAWADFFFEHNIFIDSRGWAFTLDHPDSPLSDTLTQLLSGNKEVWDDYARVWDTMYAYRHIREWRWSPYVRWSALSLPFLTDPDKITLQELFDYEAADEDTPNLFTNGQNYIQLTVESLINIYLTFVNNTRNLEESPIYDIIVGMGYSEYPLISSKLYLLETYLSTVDILEDYPDKTEETLTLEDMIEWEIRYLTQTQKNFIYPDYDRTYGTWLSYEHIALAIGQDPSTVTLAWMNENRRTVVNALIWQEARYDNVMAPVEITTSPI